MDKVEIDITSVDDDDPPECAGIEYETRFLIDIEMLTFIDPFIIHKFMIDIYPEEMEIKIRTIIRNIPVSEKQFCFFRFCIFLHFSSKRRFLYVCV